MEVGGFIKIAYQLLSRSVSHLSHAEIVEFQLVYIYRPSLLIGSLPSQSLPCPKHRALHIEILGLSLSILITGAWRLMSHIPVGIQSITQCIRGDSMKSFCRFCFLQEPIINLSSRCPTRDPNAPHHHRPRACLLRFSTPIHTKIVRSSDRSKRSLGVHEAEPATQGSKHSNILFRLFSKVDPLQDGHGDQATRSST